MYNTKYFYLSLKRLLFTKCCVVDTSFADKWKSGIDNKCNLCLVRMLCFCWKPCVRSPAQGCQTSIYCICEREIIQGEYYADNKPKSIRIRGSKDLTVIKNELYELSIAFVKRFLEPK
ncbi:unnamed protein product [Oikopleura dioica]|uniref:Uncharacterized protein n=1 Tax=Oikopleura dioica TaxID=34765 RepID=E4YE38_OIKDI|nr:unnamed protein product [Oikopleura dioica]